MYKKKIMKIKLFEKTCAFILVITMILTEINLDTLAYSINKNNERTRTKTNVEAVMGLKNQIRLETNKKTKKEPTVVKELEDLRTADSSTYLLSDGSKKLEIYGTKIHCEENGRYIDYNPTLKEMSKRDKKNLKAIVKDKNIVEESDVKNYVYVNTAGDVKQYFPETLDENMGILLQKDIYAIAFNPIDKNHKDAEETLQNAQKKQISLSLQDNSVKGSNITYIQEDGNTEFKYTSYPSGVKEEIVLNKRPENNIFEFSISIPGMKLRTLENSNRIQIIDKKTKEVVANIEEPNIKDKSGELTYEEVTYEVEEQGKGDYILKVVVDKNYLESTDTEYPIVIDPTVVWMDYALQSATVSNFPYSADINLKNGASFSVQNRAMTRVPYTDTEYFCYIDTNCSPLSGTLEQFYGSYIKDAYLKIVEYNTNENGYVPGIIEVRAPENSWNPSTITWNNHPQMSEKIWSEFICTGVANKRHNVDLKDWARAVANRDITNYGLVLKAKEQGTGAYFYGSSLQNLNYMQLVIVYREAHVGIKDIYEYESFNTPNGSGNIERSQGNFIYTQFDIALPTPQLGLGITRVYNSNSNICSGFGYGWSSDYDACVIVSEPEKTLVYRDETGALYKFTRGTDDAYTCNDTEDISIEIESKVISRITDEETPKNFSVESYYMIADKENIKYYFDVNGKLRLVEESNGTFLYIEYNQDNGIISSIYSSKGQKINFITKKHSGNKYLIDRINLEDGSYFQYDYTNELLTKVTHADGKGKQIVYVYEYNENKKIRKIYDAEGNPYQIQYDGEVVSKAIYPDNERIEISVSGLESMFSFKKEDGTTLYSEDYKFDADGKIIYKTDVSGNESTYLYNDNLLTQVKESREYHKIENGIVKTYTIEQSEKTEYNAQGNVMKEIDAEGNITKYEYAQDGINSNFPTLVTEINPKGVIVSKSAFKYDAKGNIRQEIDYIEKTVTNYLYNEDGNVTQIKDTLVDENTNLDNVSTSVLAKGLDISEEKNTYDKDGSVEESNVSTGTIVESEKNKYDILGRITQSEDKKGIVTTYVYDGFGRVVSSTQIINGKSETMTSKYDLNGLVTEEKDKLGRVITYEYDNRGRLIKQTLNYEGEMRVTSTSYGYEDISIHTGTGENETINGAKVIVVKNTTNQVISKTYTNRLGQTVREVSNGIYTDYTYDNQGNVFTSCTDGIYGHNSKLSISIYDENGRLTDTVINPLYKNGTFTVDEQNSIVTSNVYDESGNLVQTIDCKGNKTEYTYDESGRITKVSVDDNTNTSNDTVYIYGIQNKDESGNIISTTDQTINALGNVSETVLNGAGQILSIMDKATTGNIKTTYEYDVNGNVVKENHSNGCSITYAYNAKNLLTTIKEYNKKNTLVKKDEYFYNEDNLLEKCIDYDVYGSYHQPYRYTMYEYDGLNRMVGFSEVNATSQPSEEIINNHKTTYVYDIEDKLIKILYPKSSDDELKGITFTYNNFQWLTGITGIVEQNDAEVTRKIREYQYYNNGLIRIMKDYRGFLKGTEEYIQRTYEYDVFNRVTKMSYSDSSNVNNVLERYQYTYDKNSNIISENILSTYKFNTSETRTYEYDSLNRLVKSSRKIGFVVVSCASYSYDKVGNCTKMIKDGVATTYGYNALNQLVRKTVNENDTTMSLTCYSYDSSGNQILEQTMISPPTISETIQNEYDSQNQLIKTIRKKGGTEGTVQYTQENKYNDRGQRISKTDNGITTYYYYEGNVLLYTTDENGNKTSQNIIGAENNIIATIRYESDGQHAYFYNKDIRISITNIIDENGDNIVAYKYDDYGETQKLGNQEFYNEICYTSGVYDELTERYYLNARYYSTNDITFLTQDSYRGKQDNYSTWNLYAYCEGNPIAYIDPSGHEKIVVSGGVYSKTKKDSGGFYYEFIETALKNLKDISDTTEKVTWLIANQGWTKDDKKSFKKQAKKISKKIKIKYFNSKKSLIKYLNKERESDDLITSFTVYAHGFPGKIAFGYDGTSNEKKLTLKAKDIKKINKSSFCMPKTTFFSCNTATPNKKNKNFAKKWNKRLDGYTYAFAGKTNYANIRQRGTWIESKIYYKTHNVGMPIPAINYPTGENLVVYNPSGPYYTLPVS
ncbi:MAG: RHS repeat-associated core domain-containing protein [Eubacterium sp.]